MAVLGFMQKRIVLQVLPDNEVWEIEIPSHQDRKKLMLEHYLSKKLDSFACTSAVIVKDNALLLGLRHYTPDKWKNISVWTTPGGRCDEGETLEETLRRETQEEVGINDLTIVHFIGETPGAKEGDTVYMFFCSTLQDPVLMEPEKFSEWRWVPMGQYFEEAIWKEMNPPAHNLIVNYLKNLQ
ncbi:MAG: hypothetical protein COV59_05425 [Candidatus Magasanikbacteria bacterium CG11_big_fil_rev_8_21_14_0_20_39_34]|uniref:Nudix hydrolase domain-containing protein n=1 Tax=Candidatus Magasanikbacteria bacterium CG11_big_fil_rev_8_21_14_0_20_39_34 TaxID=1974653 RepID=A0A2H0N3Y3_9BACT|nr:MAG: hypothetical protein COV59_05425 [Candidatus Magasanikbacteria bacterium CG11_big_fil_rev_8_21_14_0_20_39_34]